VAAVTHAIRNRAPAIDKVVGSAAEAVADVRDGSTILVGGFGGAGFPHVLRDALIERRPRDITIVCNNADFGGFVYEGGIRTMICSYPVGATTKPLLEAIEAGSVELRLTPQGTLVEQVRAGGAGLGGVLTPTAIGTEFESRFQKVEVDGVAYLLAPALRGDVALIRAKTADRLGNLVCRHAARNFNPIFATAASLTIAEVDEIVEIGELDPDAIHIPAAFVDRVVKRS
jgi:3-oxoadipate CoA-transferase alpha subunit